MLRIISIIVLFYLSNLANAAEQLFFKHYTSNQGLIHNTVNAITQDGEGFLWFGTENGLSRFDGLSFKNYSYNSEKQHGIPFSRIQQLTSDKNGVLWLKTQNGIIARYDAHLDGFHHYGQRSNLFQNIPANIFGIYPTSDGRLWLCTNKGLYEFDYDTKHFELSQHFQALFQDNGVSMLLCDRNGVYWMVVKNQLYRIEDLFGEPQAKRISIDSEKQINLRSMVGMIEGKDGTIYLLVSGSGLYVLNPITLKTDFIGVETTPLAINSNNLRGLSSDKEGCVWIGSELGINVYDPQNQTMASYKQDFNDPAAINDNAVYAIFKDRQDNMWIGTYFGGINLWPSQGNHFKFYRAGPAPHFLSGKAVSQIIEDDMANLWVGTEDGGISYMDTGYEQFTHYKSKPHGLSYINIHALHLDAEDNLWIGSYTGGLNKYNHSTFTYYMPNEKQSIPSNSVYAIYKDKKDSLWVGTTGGLCIYHSSDDLFKRVDDLIGHLFIYDIDEDVNGNLWVGTEGNGLFLRQKEDTLFKPLHELIKDSIQALPDYINDISISSDGSIWIGSRFNGLFHIDREIKQIRQYNHQHGMPDNTVYAIVEDNNQSLWITTNNGLVHLNPVNGQMRVFTTKDGLPLKQFNYKSGYKHSNGTLYFGLVNGMIAFNPSNIKFNTDVPEIKVVNLLIQNKSIKPGDESNILSQPIYRTPKIELNHSQNDIEFEFASLDYTSPEANKFAYRLEGFDKDWIEISNTNKASYTNILPGQYTFHVRGSNNDGVWNDVGTSIELIIHPPFWTSTWGYLLYFILFLAGVWLYWHIRNIRQTEKAALAYERIEKQKIKELNQHKLRFFTNVSHEFRTPLSLIIDPLNKLKRMEMNAAMANIVNLVVNNAQRLSTLVNQLLEFHKADSGQFELAAGQADISQVFESICQRFITLAEMRQIKFESSCFLEINEVWFDEKVLDSIISNLLSNAFKYTQAGGLVSVELRSKPDNPYLLDITVADTGKGITEKDQKRIFERFYQADNDAVHESGSGIGLALTKSLVELHGGTIKVTSEKEKGSVFSLLINVSDAIQTVDAKKQSTYETDLNIVSLDTNSLTDNETTTIESFNKARLLIAEDNNELSEYLTESLKSNYEVIQTANGLIAWEKIIEDMPEIIISDVMMPEMDGLQLCRKVKEDIRTSHIPIILLTARSGVQHYFEGLKQGADIYLEKPFNTDILLRHLSNLQTLKQTWQKRFEADLGIEVKEITRSSRDEDFLKKTIKTVYEHLSDSDFKVSDLVNLMAMSRSLLHLKLKEICGQSASEFIQSIRLKEAARLLSNDQHSIMEVAEQTGFNDPSYFSRSFKKHFGQTPKSYQQNKKS